MFLQHKSQKTLIEILNIEDLYNPYRQEVLGRCHAGEELQDPDAFMKSELVFLSGETLPRCWWDAHYREMSPIAKTAIHV